MNSKLHFRASHGCSTNTAVAIHTLSVYGHGIGCYLLSMLDVVIALGIMIAICGFSLLSLYTALGAL